MKAVICTKYGPPNVLGLTSIKKPSPKPDEICIKVYKTAVTASDCIIRGFKVPIKYYLPMALVIGFKKPRKPVLGLVFSGQVESVGSQVQSFKKGDAVYGFDPKGFGAYAEYKCINKKGLLIKKPAHTPYADACALTFGWLLALYFLKKANIKSGQAVLIYGASGAVGTAAVQICKYFGAQVTGVCSTSNTALVKSLGASQVIDYTKEDFSHSSNRYDLIFNAVGKRKVKLKCKTALTLKGKHMTVDDGTPQFHRDDLILLNRLLEKKQIKAVIDRTYSLDQIVQAHAYVDQGHKKGNVIINVAKHGRSYGYQ